MKSITRDEEKDIEAIIEIGADDGQFIEEKCYEIFEYMKRLYYERKGWMADIDRRMEILEKDIKNNG